MMIRLTINALEILPCLSLEMKKYVERTQKSTKPFVCTKIQPGRTLKETKQFLSKTFLLNVFDDEVSV